jgi:hypothetical protein
MEVRATCFETGKTQEIHQLWKGCPDWGMMAQQNPQEMELVGDHDNQ